MVTKTQPTSNGELVLPSDKRTEAARNLQRASDPGRALALAAEEGKVSMTAILKTIGIDPSNPTHQAALLVSDKYGFDPLLKHVIVIPNKGIYITRDGYLHAAHQSGKLDGIEVREQYETDHHWVATVAVYRTDMSKPFVYTGRYPKNGGNKQYGPEMAIKTAEVMTLRRAFNVAGLGAADEQWDDAATYEIPAAPPASEPDDDEPVDAELVEIGEGQGTLDGAA